MASGASTVESGNQKAGGPGEANLNDADGSESVLITRRERLLRACHCQPLDHPPVWLMRQAGRVLPEYCALKEKYSFLELVGTPELAAEVTLQPIRRFDFDAAIIFSDILVIPEAMGQGYNFRDGGGIEMEFELRTGADIDRLQPDRVNEHLSYVSEALGLVRRELSDRTGLIGFVGAPWTLANFMVEGGSAKEYVRAKQLFYSEPKRFRQLLEKLTEAVTKFLKMQIAAGADVVQIFDSLGGSLAPSAYEEASGFWIREIVRALSDRVPIIVFARGVHDRWDCLKNLGARILGIDWKMDLAGVRRLLPDTIGVQGNLDPALLQTDPETVVRETQRILDSMKGLNGHIFNLGHGVPPRSKLENIEAMLTTIRSHR